MPQERLRSVVYRSFVTCEDPRGVIEGKTIRISKSDSTKSSSQKPDTQIQSSKEKEKEKEKMSSSKNLSSYEVKNGAQKLNEAYDSWSKGVNFKSQPKDIAKDLLKGALDLQESLMMLGKLQEASCMGNLKKKQEKLSEKLVGKSKSDRFEYFRSYDNMGFEKQRNSVHGSSKDCYSELRDVIRDGLSKQNLLPHKSFQESSFTDTEELAGKRKLQLSPDIASTSSSYSSSMVYSTHEFTSSDSFSSKATEEKSKGSNIIARLMGLDEFSSKPFSSKPLPSTPLNHFENRRARPSFEIDFRNPKIVRKIDRDHMTLDEIIKVMQSKGLLKSNKREMKQKRFEVDVDDVPPIVLMKPQKVKANGNGSGNVNTNPIRKLHQEKAKSEEKAVKTRDKSPSSKQKVPITNVVKPERKQEVEKKVDKVQKMAPQIKRKPIENAKVTNSVSKNSSLKQVKSQRNVISNPATKRISSINKSSNQKKNAKIEKAVNTVNEPLPAIVQEVLQIDAPNEQEAKVSKAFEEESCRVNEVVTGISHSETQNNEEEARVSDVKEQESSILKTISNFQDSDPINSGLFQDCINEFLEHENRRKKTSFTTSILTFGSEDKLMREIVKEVESLRSYNNISKESSNGDVVHGFLEKDLCSSKMGGTWSSGWKDGCTLDEIEEAVVDLERMVLSKLIDDMLVELVL